MLPQPEGAPAMPVEQHDSPLWSSLSKRGYVNISDGSPLHIYHEIFGTGSKRVVFIHGICADRQMFENLIEEFLSIGDYQCLIYDQRGNGLSGEGDILFNITTKLFAADLHSLLKAIGWDTDINIMGVSMGGMVALEFACNYPQMVSTLTLVVTNAGNSVPPLRGIIGVLRGTLSSNPLFRYALTCGLLFPGSFLNAPAPEGSQCKTMKEFCIQRYVRWESYTRLLSFPSFVCQVGAVIRHYISSARLKALGASFPKRQILVVTGDQDHLVRTSNSFHIADKIGRDRVRFEQFKNTGHGVVTQHPKRVAECVDSMINEASLDMPLSVSISNGAEKKIN